MEPERGKLAWIIPAAGRGTRLGSSLPKALVPVAGLPLVAWTLRQVTAAGQAARIAVLLPDGHHHESVWFEGLLNRTHRSTYPTLSFLPGGATRRASVKKGLSSLPSEIDWVGIHDGARPLVSTELIGRVWEAAKATGAATAALPVRDTIITEESWSHLAREKLRRIQTPQIFARRRLEEVLAQSGDDDERDEASAVHEAGWPVELVAGDPANIKVTDPEDLGLVDRLLLAQRNGTMTVESRSALGMDAHRLVGGLPLMLGGLRIDYPRGLEGHSDGDVLSHAVADALLSGARLGDLGTHFPSSDPALKGLSGRELLRRTAILLSRSGWAIDSVDALVICQAPTLAPYREQMETAMAEALGIEYQSITVKATTTDGLGFTGRGEGIAAQALVVVSKRQIRDESESNAAQQPIEDVP